MIAGRGWRLANDLANPSAGGKAQVVAADANPASDQSGVAEPGGEALEQGVADGCLLHDVR